MRSSAALAARREIPILPQKEKAKILKGSIPQASFAQPWERILEAAGDLDERSYGLSDPFSNVQMKLAVNEDVECFFINFDRFKCSEPVERYAEERGYVPAHPQSVALMANLLPNLPHDLMVEEPLTLVSLAPCYREEGETYVLGVSWDKDHWRTVSGVLYRYGWNPRHWFLFERAKPNNGTDH